MLDGDPGEKYDQISNLLSITLRTAQEYCRDARQDEKKQQQAKAWDLWLECWTQQEIADEVGVPQRTISDWISENATNCIFAKAPDSRQHFDVWSFHTANNEGGYFGKNAVPSRGKSAVALYRTRAGKRAERANKRVTNAFRRRQAIQGEEGHSPDLPAPAGGIW